MKFVLLRKTTLIKTIAVALCLVALLIGVGVTGSSAVFAGNTVRKLPIYCVETEEKAVALTFDAAWGADKTEGILKTLTDHDAKATFFVVGFWVQKYPEQLKALSESGRVEVGTHSNTHPHMPKLSKKQMELELTTSCNLIEQTISVKPTLFRPPYGDYSDALITTCEGLGLQAVQWDVDSLDWKGTGAQDMANRIISKVKNGSIVLMHNDGEHTLEALPLIIEGLKNKGYTFKTVGELIYRDGFTIDHTGKQIKTA